MCKERPSCRCCIDDILLILIIIIVMILYLYIETKHRGLLVFIFALAALSFILFLVRITEFGIPEWIQNCKNLYNESNNEESNTE